MSNQFLPSASIFEDHQVRRYTNNIGNKTGVRKYFHILVHSPKFASEILEAKIYHFKRHHLLQLCVAAILRVMSTGASARECKEKIDEVACMIVLKRSS